MKKLKKVLNYTFLIFLFFYFFTMLDHLFHIEINLTTTLLCVTGLALAIYAHARKNYIAIILLVVHMVIEWFEWSQSVLSTKETLINLAHIMMDFLFLSHELTAHLKKHRYKIITAVSIFLIGVFAFSKYFLTGIEGVDESVEFIEPFVIAGVLGCVGSHLFMHIKNLIKKKGDMEECCNEH